MNKKALSEMLSYVMLIAIVISISIGMFVWIKSFANVNPIADCEEGTSINLNGYSCPCIGVGNCTFKLTVKNNGRFNMEGVIVAISNNPKREPSYYLINKEDTKKNSPGYAIFSPPLKPNTEKEIIFTNTFQTGKPGDPASTIDKIVCQNVVIKQQIENCMMMG